MANSRIYFKSEAGGTTVVSRDTTATSGNLVLPASGNVASVDTAVTDNAIARYDGATGKLQNSSVTIDDNGNVGIGTSTPSSKLDVKLANMTSPTSNNVIVIRSQADGANNSLGATMGLCFNSRYQYTTPEFSGAGIYGVNTDNNVYGRSMGLLFKTSTVDANSIERMRLASNGNLLVGTTTDNGIDKLQVNGSISKKIENSNGVEFKLGNSIWSISIPQGTVQTANQIFSTMSIPVHTGGMYILYAMYNNTMPTSSKVYHFHSSYDGTSKGSSITLISQGGYTGDSWYGNCKLTLTTTPSSTTLNFVAEANITSQNPITYHLVKIGI